MSAEDEWMSAAALARLRLKTLSPAKDKIIARATVEKWPFRQREGRGGGREYLVATLPEPIRLEIDRQRNPAPAPVKQAPPPAPLTPSSHLTNWQRKCQEARLALLVELDWRSRSTSLAKAVTQMVADAAAGTLTPPHLNQLVPVANARSGKNGARTLSARTLMRWRAAHKAQGNPAVAPREASLAATGAPAWAPALMRLWQRPQKPSLRAIMEVLPDTLPAGVAAPSYDQVRRYLRTLSVIDLNRGRLGPRKLKELKAFTRRDVSLLQPLDVVLMDGHQDDREVEHPTQNGRPFRPEITSVLDAKTRKLLGFSLGLAESTLAVIDALKMAARWGVAAILYVDNGSGYENAVVSSPVVGLLARLGTRHESSLPYNSQARGLIERAHATIWVRAAKESPTFLGRDMDEEARHKVHKLTRSAVRTGASSPLVMPWTTYCQSQAQVADAYNNRPHRGLPKITDPVTGKQRHQCPNEAWNAAVEAGWEPVLLTQEEGDALFRPAKEVTTNRGEINLRGQLYFARELEHWTGQQVVVAWEVGDASRVWVSELGGKPICEALFEANKRHFFPVTHLEKAREERARGRERRLQAQLEQVRAEAKLPVDVACTPIDAETERLAAEQLAKLAPPAPALPAPHADGRPYLEDNEAFYRWMMGNPPQAHDGDRKFLAELLSSKTFRLLVDHPEARPAAAGEEY